MSYVWRVLVCLVIAFTQVQGFMNIFRPNPGCGGGGIPCPPQRMCGQRPCLPPPIQWSPPKNCGQGQSPCGPSNPYPPPLPAVPYGSQYKATVSTSTTAATTTTDSPIQCVRDGFGICAADCLTGNYTMSSTVFSCGFDGEVCCLIDSSG